MANFFDRFDDQKPQASPLPSEVGGFVVGPQVAAPAPPRPSQPEAPKGYVTGNVPSTPAGDNFFDRFDEPKSTLDTMPAERRPVGGPHPDNIGFVPSSERELTQFGKGLRAGYEGLKATGQAFRVAMQSGAIDSKLKRLENLDRIDRGEPPQPIGQIRGTPPPGEAIAYMGANPELRKEIRDSLVSQIANDEQFRSGLIDSWRSFTEEAAKFQGRTPSVFDIEDVGSFLDYVGYSAGEAIPSLAAVIGATLAGGAVAGPAGAGAALMGVATPLGAGGINSELLQRGITDEYAAPMTVGAVSGLAERAGGVPGRAVRNWATDRIGQEVTKSYIKRLLPEIPANMTEEALVEGVQTALEQAVVSGMTAEEFFTTENLRQVVDSMAKGAVAGPIGAPLSAFNPGQNEVRREGLPASAVESPAAQEPAVLPSPPTGEIAPAPQTPAIEPQIFSEGQQVRITDPGGPFDGAVGRVVNPGEPGSPGVEIETNGQRLTVGKGLLTESVPIPEPRPERPDPQQTPVEPVAEAQPEAQVELPREGLQPIYDQDEAGNIDTNRQIGWFDPATMEQVPLSAVQVETASPVEPDAQPETSAPESFEQVPNPEESLPANPPLSEEQQPRADAVTSWLGAADQGAVLRHPETGVEYEVDVRRSRDGTELKRLIRPATNTDAQEAVAVLRNGAIEYQSPESAELSVPKGRPGRSMGRRRVDDRSGAQREFDENYTPPRRPPALLDFIRSNGGIRVEDNNIGDLRGTLDRGAFRVLRRNGLPLDMMREAAAEQGFLPADSTNADFLDLISRDAYAAADSRDGRRIYPTDWMDRGIEYDQAVEGRRQAEQRYGDVDLGRFPSLDMAEAYLGTREDLALSIQEAENRLDAMDAEIDRLTREALAQETADEQRSDEFDIPFDFTTDAGREGDALPPEGDGAPQDGGSSQEPGGESEVRARRVVGGSGGQGAAAAPRPQEIPVTFASLLEAQQEQQRLATEYERLMAQLEASDANLSAGAPATEQAAEYGPDTTGDNGAGGTAGVRGAEAAGVGGEPPSSDAGAPRDAGQGTGDAEADAGRGRADDSDAAVEPRTERTDQGDNYVMDVAPEITPETRQQAQQDARSRYAENEARVRQQQSRLRRGGQQSLEGVGLFDTQGDLLSGPPPATDTDQTTETPAPEAGVSDSDTLFRAPDLAEGERLRTRLASGLYGEFRPNLTSDGEKAAQAVIDTLKRIAPDANSRVFERLTDDDGYTKAFGVYLDGMISIALDNPDAVGTARHEAIHFLREIGAITPGQWDALSAAAERNGWADEFNIDARYKQIGVTLTPAQRTEEAVAEAYAAWGRGSMKVPPQLDRIFQAMRRMFMRVRTAVREALGYDPDYADIFGGIETGRAGRGNGAAPPRNTAQMQAPRQVGFPEAAAETIHTFTSDADIKAHPDYRAAKSGDPDAAQRLVDALVKPQQIRQARARFGEGAIYAPVIAEEMSGRNKIPVALAAVYAGGAGGSVTAGIRQANRAFHTGARPMDRIISRPMFEGNVIKGGRYVIVDDVTVMGGTLTEMADYIQANGGEVVGAVTLVNAGRSGYLKASPQQISKIKGRYGDVLRDEIGIDPGALTRDEAVYVLGFRDADALRAGIAKARNERQRRLSSQKERREGGVSRYQAPPADDQPALGQKYRNDAPSDQLPRRRGRGSDRPTQGQIPELPLNLQEPPWYRRLQEAMQDKMVHWKTMQKAVEEARGYPLSNAENVYLQEELYIGKAGERLDEMTSAHIKPIAQAVADSDLRGASIAIPDGQGGEQTVEGAEILEAYLYARHAPERNAQIASINEDFPDGGSGMTDADAATVMKTIDDAGLTDTAKHLASMVDAMNAEALQNRVDAGLMSPQQAEKWRQTYRYYVPLRGNAESDDPIMPSVNRGYQARGPESRRALGRGSRATDILAQTFVQAQESIIRAEKNHVFKTLLNLVQNNPAPEVWEVNKTRMAYTLNKSTGQVEYKPVNPIAAADADRTVSGKVNGQEVRITLNDPYLARSFQNIGAETPNALLRMAMAYSRIQSSLNTSWNPEFVVTNAFRDIQSALINIQQHDIDGIARDVFWNWRKGLVGALRGRDLEGTSAVAGLFINQEEQRAWEDAFKRYSKAGGRVSFWKIGELSDHVADIKAVMRAAENRPQDVPMKAIKGVLDYIENANVAVDNAVRLAAFKAAVDRGIPEENAASLAKNLTVNFNRKGTLGPTMNALYMFYNASIQGTAVMIDAIVNRPKKMIPIYAGIVALGATVEMLNAMLSPEDDDGELLYDKIGGSQESADFLKSRNMIFIDPFGLAEDGYWSIPLPYGYNFFFEAGRNIAATMRGGQSPARGGMNTLRTAMDMFNPIGTGQNLLITMMPTITKPLGELAMNENFMGGPIYPEPSRFDASPDPYSHQPWRNTSPTSTEVAQWLNGLTGGDSVRPGEVDLPPQAIDHVFGFYGGAAWSFWSRLGQSLGEQASAVVRGEDPPEIELRDIPFARKVYRTKPPYRDRGEAYDAIRDIYGADQQRRSYLETGKQDEARAFVQERRAVLALRPYAKEVRSQLKDFRNAKKALEERGIAQTDPRYERIAMQEEKVITNFLRRYKDATANERPVQEGLKRAVQEPLRRAVGN